jgi:hypothetical protein
MTAPGLFRCRCQHTSLSPADQLGQAEPYRCAFVAGFLPAPTSEQTLAPLRSRRLDWAALAKVLAHLDLPTTLPQPAPARAPPSFEEDLDQGAFDLDAEMDQRAL